MSRFLFIALCIFGAAIAMKERTHFAITMLTDKFPAFLRTWLEVGVALATSVLLSVVIYKGWGIVLLNRNQDSPALGVNMSIAYAAIPLGTMLMLVFLWTDFIIKRYNRDAAQQLTKRKHPAPDWKRRPHNILAALYYLLRADGSFCAHWDLNGASQHGGSSLQRPNAVDDSRSEDVHGSGLFPALSRAFLHSGWMFHGDGRDLSSVGASRGCAGGPHTWWACPCSHRGHDFFLGGVGLLGCGCRRHRVDHDSGHDAAR